MSMEARREEIERRVRKLWGDGAHVVARNLGVKFRLVVELQTKPGSSSRTDIHSFKERATVYEAQEEALKELGEAMSAKGLV